MRERLLATQSMEPAQTPEGPRPDLQQNVEPAATTEGIRQELQLKVDHWIHAGGVIGGLVLGLVFRRRELLQAFRGVRARYVTIVTRPVGIRHREALTTV